MSRRPPSPFPGGASLDIRGMGPYLWRIRARAPQISLWGLVMHHQNVHKSYMKAARAAKECPEREMPGDEAFIADRQVIPDGDNAGEHTADPHALPENLDALCKEHICPSCAIQTEADEQRLRAAAEMENFKKRLAREHEEMAHYAAEKVLRDLLPALDNLDLALQYGSQNDACRDMVQGVAMTRKQLLEAVARHGLAPVGVEGELFTPELHEAVGFDARPEMEKNAVARVLQSGYKLGERLLRPAKVMINQ